MENKGTRGKECVWLGIMCLVCFLSHIVVVNQFNGWFCTDTDGYWLHAATFTGHDWSGVASKVSKYYAWGYSIVLIIPMLLTNDILVMSRIAVVMNAIFCALTILPLYSMGKKLFKEMKQRVIMTAALITSLYPSYFLDSAVALAEAFIYFLYVLLVYLVLQYLETNEKYWAVLSSTCCGYLYISHHRNLGMVVAFVFLILVLFIKNRDWKELSVMIIPMILMLVLDSFVNEWLNIREMAGAVYTSNTYGSVGKKAILVLNFKGIIFAIQSLLGAVWYLFAGTFTIAGLGIIHMIRKIGEKISAIDEKNRIFFLYSLLNVIMMMGISVVFWTRMTNHQERIDPVFYGRYFECTISILLFVGLVVLSNIEKSKKIENDLKIIIWCLICLGLWTNCFTQEITGTYMNHFSVAAVLFPFSYPNVQFSVIGNSVFVLCLVLLIEKLMMCKEQGYRIFTYILIAVGFLYVGYNGTINTREIYVEQATIANYPIYNEEFKVMNLAISELQPDSLYIYDRDGYEAFTYQLFHLDVNVITVKSKQEIEQTAVKYILLSKDIAEEVLVADVVMETTNYILCKIL